MVIILSELIFSPSIQDIHEIVCHMISVKREVFLIAAEEDHKYVTIKADKQYI